MKLIYLILAIFLVSSCAPDKDLEHELRMSCHKIGWHQGYQRAMFFAMHRGAPSFDMTYPMDSTIFDLKLKQTK